MRLPALSLCLLTLAALLVSQPTPKRSARPYAPAPDSLLHWQAVRTAQLALAFELAQPPPRTVHQVDSLAQAMRARALLDALAVGRSPAHVLGGVYPALLREAPLEAPEAAYRYLLVAYQLPALSTEVLWLGPPSFERLPLLLTAIDVLRPIAYLGLPPAPMADARAALDALRPLATRYADLEMPPDWAAQLRARRLDLAALARHWRLIEDLHANLLETAATRLRLALRDAPSADRPFLDRLGRQLALRLADAGRHERALSILALLDRPAPTRLDTRSL